MTPVERLSRCVLKSVGRSQSRMKSALLLHTFTKYGPGFVESPLVNTQCVPWCIPNPFAYDVTKRVSWAGRFPFGQGAEPFEAHSPGLLYAPRPDALLAIDKVQTSAEQWPPYNYGVGMPQATTIAGFIVVRKSIPPAPVSVTIKRTTSTTWQTGIFGTSLATVTVGTGTEIENDNIIIWMPTPWDANGADGDGLTWSSTEARTYHEVYFIYGTRAGLYFRDQTLPSGFDRSDIHPWESIVRSASTMQRRRIEAGTFHVSGSYGERSVYLSGHGRSIDEVWSSISLSGPSTTRSVSYISGCSALRAYTSYVNAGTIEIRELSATPGGGALLCSLAMPSSSNVNILVQNAAPLPIAKGGRHVEFSYILTGVSCNFYLWLEHANEIPPPMDTIILTGDDPDGVRVVPGGTHADQVRDLDSVVRLQDSATDTVSISPSVDLPAAPVGIRATSVCYIRFTGRDAGPYKVEARQFVSGSWSAWINQTTGAIEAEHDSATLSYVIRGVALAKVSIVRLDSGGSCLTGSVAATSIEVRFVAQTLTPTTLSVGTNASIANNATTGGPYAKFTATKAGVHAFEIQTKLNTVQSAVASVVEITGPEHPGAYAGPDGTPWIQPDIQPHDPQPEGVCNLDIVTSVPSTAGMCAIATATDWTGTAFAGHSGEIASRPTTGAAWTFQKMRVGSWHIGNNGRVQLTSSGFVLHTGTSVYSNTVHRTMAVGEEVYIRIAKATRSQYSGRMTDATWKGASYNYTSPTIIVTEPP